MMNVDNIRLKIKRRYTHVPIHDFSRTTLNPCDRGFRLSPVLPHIATVYVDVRIETLDRGRLHRNQYSRLML